MKTIEQKAKAYDEIIERAKTMLSAGEVMYGKENNASQLITDLIPELRESEDERIKKAILSALRGGIDTEKYLEKHGTNYGEVQDWLERQKEQKPTDLPPGFYFIIEDGKKYYSKELRFDDCKIKLGPKACDDKDAIVANSEKQDYSGLTDFERAIHRGFLCAGVENVPVTIIKETAQDCLAQIKFRSVEEARKACEPDYVILKKEDYERLQKPTWSEEDEKMRNLAIEWAETMSGQCSFVGMDSTDFRKIATWLKSLRPQPKPSWKPSEEQLRALNHFLDFHRPQYMASTHGWSAYEGLKSLYDQLLKLKSL